MSFAYMPLYTGDYLRDTRHLTPLRHGIYLLLLMHCWDQKGPLPLDEQECAGIANCRSADEVDALRYVLERYFVRMDDGSYNKRMTEILTHAESIAASRRLGGFEKARRQRDLVRVAVHDAQAELMQSSSNASPGNPNPNPNPNPKEKEKKPASAGHEVYDPKKDLFDMGVKLLTSQGTSEQSARSFLGKYAKVDQTKLAALVGECFVNPKADAKSYIAAAMQPRKRGAVV